MSHFSGVECWCFGLNTRQHIVWIEPKRSKSCTRRQHEFVCLFHSLVRSLFLTHSVLYMYNLSPNLITFMCEFAANRNHRPYPESWSLYATQADVYAVDQTVNLQGDWLQNYFLFSGSAVARTAVVKVIVFRFRRHRQRRGRNGT